MHFTLLKSIIHLYLTNTISIDLTFTLAYVTSKTNTARAQDLINSSQDMTRFDRLNTGT